MMRPAKLRKKTRSPMRWRQEKCAHSYYTAVLQDETAAIDYYKKRLAKENSNFFFTLTDTDGNVKLENYQYHDALQTIDADLHFEVEQQTIP